MHIVGVSEREERESGQGEEIIYEEIIMETFPNLIIDLINKYPESSANFKQNELKRPTPKHIIIKLQKAKDKKRFLKAARGK